MSALVIDLKPALRERLRAVAKQAGKREEELAAEWLDERLAEQPALNEQARGIEVLRQAGMLTELGPELKKRAARAHLTLDEVREIMARGEGMSLSELVLEQRGPKL